MLHRLSSQCKISPATAVHPDAALVESPAIPAAAGCIASLPDQAYPIARISGTEVSSAVVGRAGDQCSWRRTRWWIARSGSIKDTDDEVRPAAAINPDAAPIIAPAVALPARRSASLIHHAHAVACVSGAVVPVAVIGGAGDSRAISICSPALRRKTRCS